MTFPNSLLATYLTLFKPFFVFENYLDTSFDFYHRGLCGRAFAKDDLFFVRPPNHQNTFYHKLGWSLHRLSKERSVGEPFDETDYFDDNWTSRVYLRNADTFQRETNWNVVTMKSSPLELPAKLQSAALNICNDADSILRGFHPLPLYCTVYGLHSRNTSSYPYLCVVKALRKSTGIIGSNVMDTYYQDIWVNSPSAMCIETRALYTEMR